MNGRFAPSPTGEFHLGNLRTALVAWLAARGSGRGFVVRIEDLDPVASSDEHERRQLADLAALGLDWDGDVWRQSERFDAYDAALEQLRSAGRLYECFCSRREIREAAAAPHGSAELVYPGTCRNLTTAQRRQRSGERPAALRYRADDAAIEFVDAIAGPQVGHPNDVVVRRNDGVPAYQISVVVDDAAQSISQVVRGDDLLASTPTQIALQGDLGLPTPDYAHVPMVTGPTGARLAKRDGAVTLSDLAAVGVTVDDVRAMLGRSLGLVAAGEPLTVAGLRALAGSFDAARLRALAGDPIPFATL